jgi:hypothetical protein
MGRKKITTEEFISKANGVHDFKYDYSGTKYVKSSEKVCIICPEHGEFWQEANSHLRGSGCRVCSNNMLSNKFRNTFEVFIESANKIHGQYEYVLTSYKNSKTKMCIICPEHGEFWQSPNNHLQGHGCPYCVGLGVVTIESFISRSIELHNNKYDYSKVNCIDNNRSLVTICCSEHGEFIQQVNSHMNGRGCPACKDSSGEKLIRKFLLELNIPFDSQWSFDDCRDKAVLPFDFRLDNGVLIEYDGIQHFKPIKFFGGLEKYVELKKRDQIKDAYCERNDLTLIRLPYTMSASEIKKLIMEVSNG